jgi:hypothetical protein
MVDLLDAIYTRSEYLTRQLFIEGAVLRMAYIGVMMQILTGCFAKLNQKPDLHGVHQVKLSTAFLLGRRVKAEKSRDIGRAVSCGLAETGCKYR